MTEIDPDRISEHFRRSEFACPCGCGFDTVDATLLEVLERARNYFRAPITITSGCRCPTYNARVGGAKNSQHLRGRAADIVVQGVHPDRVHAFLSMGTESVGKYDTFTHVDTRSGRAARWEG